MQSTTYDGAGRVTQRLLGNSTVLQAGYSYYPWTSVGGQGCMQRMTLGASGAPTSLQDLTYQYDAVGNVKQQLNITPWSAAQRQCFSYDGLNRLLTGFTTAASDNCTVRLGGAPSRERLAPFAANRWLHLLANVCLRFLAHLAPYHRESLELHAREQVATLPREMTDAITLGDLTGVFVEQNHSLALWSVNDRAVASVQHVAGNWDARKTNLWRPQFANQQGGASQNAYCLMPGEVTSPEAASSFGTNIYRWVMGDEYASNTLTLPMDWYRGTNSHVRAYQWFAGFAQQDAGDIAGYAFLTYGAYAAAKKASGSLVQRMGHGTKEGVGGLAGALVIAVDIFSKTLWDTYYVVESGPGTPPPLLAPRPPLAP